MTRHAHLLFGLLLLTSWGATARTVPSIPLEQAEREARQQVLWNGRVCTFNTVARHFTKTIYGKSSYRGLTAEQVVYGWIARPDAWKEEPMILIQDQELRRRLGIEGSYATFAQLFDDTQGYRLNTLGAELPSHMQQLVREWPSVQELDEKVGLIVQLTQGQLLQPRPAHMEALSDWQVELELLSNRFSVFPLLLVGGVLLCLVVYFFRRVQQPPQSPPAHPSAAS